MSATCGRYAARVRRVACRDMSTAFCSRRSSGRFSAAVSMLASGVDGSRVIVSLSSSASVMSLLTGRPHNWQSSILASDRPLSTCVRAISASFTFTLTFSPSARVATPSFIILSTSPLSLVTRSRKLLASRCLCFSDTTVQ